MSAVERAAAELERARPGYLPRNWRSEQGPGDAFAQILDFPLGLENAARLAPVAAADDVWAA